MQSFKFRFLGVTILQEVEFPIFLSIFAWTTALPVIIFMPSILHSQRLKIGKSKNVSPEWLRWGLGNYERVGKAHCIETLNFNCSTLVQERSFPRIGCAKRGSSPDFFYEAVSLV